MSGDHRADLQHEIPKLAPSPLSGAARVTRGERPLPARTGQWVAQRLPEVMPTGKPIRARDVSGPVLKAVMIEQVRGNPQRDRRTIKHRQPGSVEAVQDGAFEHADMHLIVRENAGAIGEV